MVRNLRKLMVWQKTDQLVLALYQATQAFPSAELERGLGQQLRTCALACMSALVAGSQRRSTSELLGALRDSQTQLDLIDYYLGLAQRLGYLDSSQLATLLQLRSDAAGLLQGFCYALQRQTEPAPVLPTSSVFHPPERLL